VTDRRTDRHRTTVSVAITRASRGQNCIPYIVLCDAAGDIQCKKRVYTHDKVSYSGRSVNRNVTIRLYKFCLTGRDLLSMRGVLLLYTPPPCWTARASCSHIGDNCKWGSRVWGELAEDKGTSFGLQGGYAPPADWRRQLGRPRITWLSTIQQDLKHHNLTIPEAADLAQNRPLWRMMSTYGATQSWVARQKRRRRRHLAILSYCLALGLPPNILEYLIELQNTGHSSPTP